MQVEMLSVSLYKNAEECRINQSMGTDEIIKVTLCLIRVCVN